MQYVQRHRYNDKRYNVEDMKYIWILLILGACTKPKDCELPVTLEYHKVNEDLCTPEKTVIDTIRKELTLCECEDECEDIQRAYDNSIKIYQNQLDTLKGDQYDQVYRTYLYLFNNPFNCDCYE